MTHRGDFLFTPRFLRATDGVAVTQEVARPWLWCSPWRAHQVSVFVFSTTGSSVLLLLPFCCFSTSLKLVLLLTNCLTLLVHTWPPTPALGFLLALCFEGLSHAGTQGTLYCESNRGQLHAREVPYVLGYLSGPILTPFAQNIFIWAWVYKYMKLVCMTNILLIVSCNRVLLLLVLVLWSPAGS